MEINPNPNHDSLSALTPIIMLQELKTQDVPLDGTIFFGNTGQKDRATFMNKKVPIELS